MVVELKPSEAKGEEGKKKWTDFVPVTIPEARKKKAAVGCGTVVFIIFVTIVIVACLAVGGYFAADSLLSEDGKRANIYCEEDDCEECYDDKYMHGRPECDEDDEEIAEEAEEMYEAWMDILEGKSVQATEYIKENNGVYTIEVVPTCDRLNTFIVIDTNIGYTAVKAQMSDDYGSGYHCMLFDNEAMMQDTIDEIQEFDYDSGTAEYNMPVRSIASFFFEYGEPVPTADRSYLSDEINELCPMNEQPFYYMIDGEDAFRAQVEDIMYAYKIEYDDIFYWFVEIYEYFMMESGDELEDLLDGYDLYLGILPVGDYASTSPTGVGWSLNIWRASFYAYWDTTYTYEVATFEWTGTLVPPSDP